MTSTPFLPKMNPGASRIPFISSRGIGAEIRQAAVDYSNRVKSASVAGFVFNVSARSIVRWRKAAEKRGSSL